MATGFIILLVVVGVLALACVADLRGAVAAQALQRGEAAGGPTA